MPNSPGFLASKKANCQEVYITTPDEEIIEYIKNKYKTKVKTFKRNWQMARFGITVDQTLTDLFDNLPKNLNHFQSVCVLYIEYPFRNSKFTNFQFPNS